MMQYWVYDNWTHKKAIVHRGSCSYCSDGRGMHAGSTKRNGEWRGPYREAVDASRKARSTGRDEVRGCKTCGP